jgi:predicted phage terminase large subunit-like protein
MSELLRLLGMEPKETAQDVARRELEKLREHKRARARAAAPLPKASAPMVEQVQARIDADAEDIRERVLDGQDPVAVWYAILYQRCTQSFRRFVEEFWDVVNPGRKLQRSYAIEIMADALQATVDGGPKQLLVACPPGVSKSILCAVLFPAWILLRTDGKARIMVGSYSWDFAERDSTKCRDLILSEKFQLMLEGRWTIRPDRSAVSDWWTTSGGRRLITSVEGKSTGERVDYQIVDDPLSAGQVTSDAARKEASRWVNEVLPSRLDDVDEDQRCVRVIVHQRLAVDDPIGVILAADPDQVEWAYCKLPALLREGDKPTECVDPVTGRTWWRDTRKIGEPLFAGLSAKKIARLSHPSVMGPTAVAIQYFQNPVDEAAATIRRAWWRWYLRPNLPPGVRPPHAATDESSPSAPMPERFEKIVVAADLTFGSKKKAADHNAIQAWGRFGAGRYLLRTYHKKAGLLECVRELKSFARQFVGVKILIEQAANGGGAGETLVAQGVPGVILVPAIGSKKDRIGLVSATIESGCAFLPQGDPRMKVFIEELAGATGHDDLQDACAYAIHELNKDASSDWPETQAKQARAEAVERGEEPPPLVRLVEKLNRLFRGVKVGKRDIQTGAPVEHEHYYVDGRCVNAGCGLS